MIRCFSRYPGKLVSILLITASNLLSSWWYIWFSRPFKLHFRFSRSAPLPISRHSPPHPLQKQCPSFPFRSCLNLVLKNYLCKIAVMNIIQLDPKNRPTSQNGKNERKQVKWLGTLFSNFALFKRPMVSLCSYFFTCIVLIFYPILVVFLFLIKRSLFWTNFDDTFMKSLSFVFLIDCLSFSC